MVLSASSNVVFDFLELVEHRWRHFIAERLAVAEVVCLAPFLFRSIFFFVEGAGFPVQNHPLRVERELKLGTDAESKPLTVGEVLWPPRIRFVQWGAFLRIHCCPCYLETDSLD